MNNKINNKHFYMIFDNAGLGAGKKSLQLREDRLRQQQEAIQRELLKDPAKLRRELQG